MATTYPDIDDHIRAFIAAQRLFFVASSPLSEGGHVNLSPKGLDSFRVFGPRRVAYLDFNGSGIETVAHVRENGRLTIMFCAFEGQPNILRLQGRARAVEPDDPDFPALHAAFAPAAAVRSIIVLDITRLAFSCGFGVPLFEYKGERRQLLEWSEKKGDAGLCEYQRKHNARSIDGLRGLQGADPASE